MKEWKVRVKSRYDADDGGHTDVTVFFYLVYPTALQALMAALTLAADHALLQSGEIWYVGATEITTGGSDAQETFRAAESSARAVAGHPDGRCGPEN
jgi:hypothetical protein